MIASSQALKCPWMSLDAPEFKFDSLCHMANSKNAAHVMDFANYVPRFLQDAEI
jgi:hypothetical protein